MREILVIGGSSFVASEALKGLSTSSCKITAPSKGDLDIQNVESIRGYTKDADAVINFVAYTNVKAATTSQSGEAWKLNVEGTANIASVCKSEGKFLIHVSTDGVFPITGDFKGLHSENETINDDPTLVSAYGYTKLMGEREIDRCGTKAAILRIAYPFGNIAFPEKDYVTKLIRSVKLGYALFSDQEFTPTYIRSLPKVIGKLLENELSGVFHWVCRGLTTPYKVGMFINEKLNLV